MVLVMDGVGDGVEEEGEEKTMWKRW